MAVGKSSGSVLSFVFTVVCELPEKSHTILHACNIISYSMAVCKILLLYLFLRISLKFSLLLASGS